MFKQGLKSILCALLTLSIALLCACSGEQSGFVSSTDSDASGLTSSSSASQPEQAPKEPHPTTVSQWEAVPIVSQKQKDAGFAGGEGCQWPTYISFDHIDGSLAFFGTDVGGMYRSLDGGVTWSPCTIGLNANAAGGIEIDPTNNKRVLCVGCDSYADNTHGVYLSVDSGETWKQVSPQSTCGHRDFRHQIAFDKSSFDKTKGYCTVAYFLRESKNYSKTDALPTALFRSDDGGETWQQVCSDNAIRNGQIYVNPENGWVYVSTVEHTVRSTDGGKTFSVILDKPSYGLCVINNKPNNLYVSAQDGFYLSTDSGNSFNKIDQSGYPTTYPARVKVSPANPDNIVLQDDHLSASGSYSSANYVSNDGGKTWRESKIDASMSFIPYNKRQTVFAWHPTDENICISTGGDMIMRSTDAGKSFSYSATGYNGSCTTGIYINVNNNDLIFASNQDYNGAVSVDGGETWVYTDWSGVGWGGFSYGGYCVNEDTVVGITRVDGTHYIAMLSDGFTKRTVTDLVVTGSKRGMGMIGRENIVFLGEYRSDDYGKTWSKMEGCSGVYTCSANGVLYGVYNRYFLVKSTDGGITWTQESVFEDLADIKYDEFNKRILILASNGIYTVNTKKLPELINAVNSRFNSFDIDPETGYIYAANYNVHRSTDSGKTWVNMSRNPYDGSVGPDGGKKAGNLIFNRKQGYVWVTGGCRGIWRIAAKR